MTDAQVLAAAIVAPALIIGAVAMVRGYHVWIHLYRPKGEDAHGHPHPDHHHHE